MKEGEENLTFAKHLPFRDLRLFHFHDHLCLRKDILSVGDDSCAGLSISSIVCPDAKTGTGLDQDPMPVRHVFPNCRWREAHPTFVCLDLFRA